MQVEIALSEAQHILQNLPEIKLSRALDFLKLLKQLPDDRLDVTEEYIENLGWSMLASEVAEKEWE